MGWDREMWVKAQGLLSVMKSLSFLVAFITVKNVLEIMQPLTVKLQKRDIYRYFERLRFDRQYKRGSKGAPF